MLKGDYNPHFALRTLALHHIEKFFNCHRSPVLLATVHKTLETWVGMSRDYDTPFMTPVLRSLLNSSNHTHLRHSSLKALSTLVSFIGPLVPPPLASSILQLCLEGLTPCPPCEETLVLLRLLMACVFSGNTHLAPPTNAAIQLLTDLVNQHTSREVCIERFVTVSL